MQLHICSAPAPFMWNPHPQRMHACNDSNEQAFERPLWCHLYVVVSPIRPEQIGIIGILWHHSIAALQVGAEFLALHYPVHTVLLPNPTWANHNKIFPLAGIKDVRKYRYFKPSTKGLDYEVTMLSDIH